MTTALFETDGDRYVPTPLARGPWDATALHGGPPSALLAREIEAASTPDGVAMAVARLTVELERPVPLEPLAVSTAVVRSGRKVQLVDAVLTIAASGAAVARARAVRIRTAPVALPYEDPLRGPLLVPEPPPPPPDGVPRSSPVFDSGVAFHRDAIDLRFVEGAWDEPGPVTLWGRLLVPVVPGEEPSPFQRTMALADMGNGVSGIVDFDTHLFINPELSVHLWRLPVGDWIGLRARSDLGPAGIGLADSVLYDRSGHIGRALQSLFVDTR